MKKQTIILFTFLFITLVLSAQSKLKDIAQKADNAVFTILTYDSSGREVGKGCGFFVDTTGRAIGRAHIFRKASKAIAVLDNGRKLKIKKIISVDNLSNTALFSVKKKKKGYSFFKDEYITPVSNEEVLILKNVKEKNSKVDLGRLKRIVTIEGFGELTELEQTVNESNDGCPVINRDGKLIGVASMIPEGKVNYSINYKGLADNNKSLIDFSGHKRLPGHKRTKFPALRSFTPVYLYILEENFEKALDEINIHLEKPNGAIANENDKRTVLFLKAYIEKKMRLFDEAKKTYTDILEIKIDDEIAFLERAKLKVKMGDLASAGKDLEESLASTKKNQAFIKKLQGDLYAKLDDIHKADQLYLDAQNLGYNKYDLFRERSKIYVKRGAFDKAKELIGLAIVANPYEPSLYILRGEINAELGKTEDAMADFDQSEKLGKPNMAGMKIMARTKLKARDNEGAIKTLEQAYIADPEDRDILLMRGQSFNEIQNYEEAKANLDKLIKIDAFNAKGYYERGKTHLALSMMSESINDFSKSLQLDPDYAGAYLDRGVAFGLIGDFNKAIQDFENAVALDPKSGEGNYNLGLAKFQTKNRLGACKAWNKSLEQGYEEAEQYIEKYCSSKNFTQRGR